jgi:hypothetical protein
MNNINFEKINLEYQPEPNTAKPIVEVNGRDVVLTFELKTEDVKNNFGKILFKDVYVYRVGGPNDEGFYLYGTNPKIKNETIYSKKNFPELEFDSFYKVINYDWGNNLLGEGSIKLGGNIDTKDEYIHYIFFMKDGTFECVAKSFEII